MVQLCQAQNNGNFSTGILLSSYAVRPLQNAPFCSISASDSNFNPRNTQCIPVVKIIVFLELKQKLTFFKGLAVIKNLS